VKKKLLIVIFGLIIIAVLFGIFSCVHRIAIADITASFEENLAAFVLANNEKLPQNWTDFANWTAKSEHREWRVEELDKRFSVPWGMDPRLVIKRPIITVLLPDLKYLEHDINASFERQLQLKSGENLPLSGTNG